MNPKQGHILYLHGFLSSPHSQKAQQMQAYLALNFPHIQLHLPQLSGKPAQAIDQAERVFSTLLQQYQQEFLGVVGSSMGGFLAAHLLNTISAQPKAVLINPAVAPHRLFPDYVGEHTNPYTQEQFSLEAADIRLVEQRYIASIGQPQQFQVWLETGDEVLDYQLAQNLYKDSECHVTHGGDHAYQNFVRELPQICAFLACERFAQ